jgi:hypothetical protein
MVHLFLSKSPQQESARIDARGRMALHKNEIATVLVGGSVPEMIEPYVIQRGARGKASNMTTYVGVLVGAKHHR